MELDWSEQSPHIRTLYRSWQPEDGYEESIITAAEDRLGVRLPAPLRIFYQAWGRREDMTQTVHFVIGPIGLVRRPDVLVFCIENQGCCWWAIERQVLEEPDPPVVIVNPENWNIKDIQARLTWEPSHAHLSDFLDTLTYFHALCGGAMHGGYGYSEKFRHREPQDPWLGQYWHRTTVGPMVFGLADTYNDDLPFYVRDGQALTWFHEFNAAVRDTEALDEIGQALQVTWTHRW